MPTTKTNSRPTKKKTAKTKEVTRQVKWGNSNKESGGCFRCGKPRSTRSKWFCDACLDKMALMKKLKQMDKLQKEIDELQNPTKKPRPRKK